MYNCQGLLPYEEAFSRRVLPQSLSPLLLDGNWAMNSGNEEALCLQIDLNRNVFTASTCNISKESTRNCSNNGSEVTAFKSHLLETEKMNNINQEESSRKRGKVPRLT